MTDATRRALVKIYGTLIRAGWGDDAPPEPSVALPRKTGGATSKGVIADPGRTAGAVGPVEEPPGFPGKAT